MANLTPSKPTQSKTTPPPILFILLSIGLVFGLSQLRTRFSSSPSAVAIAVDNATLAKRMSLGDKVLVSSKVSSEKQAGVAAFRKGDFKTAVDQFQASLQGDRNDPETLIYLNNAKISDRPFYRIAVVVPMGSNPNIAQEIMRGVAQAQDELNQKDGINGKGLQVALINDDNESEVAKQVATALVNDPETLAVIGHNASNASLAAAPIYQNSGLVMITSTGFANGLSGFGSYIFRTSPDMRSTADVLADYVVKTTRKNRIAVCYDSQAPDNVSFKDEFVVALSALGGKLVPTVCDLSSPSFNPDAAMTEALNKGAEGLLLTPHIDRISYAIALARANRGRLPLYSSPSLYTMQTLEQGQIDMKGLVFPAPWHPQAGPAFATTARQYWGGMVNWRTATSYDAASAIITALQKGTTRTDLQQVLRNPSFQSPGASNTVRFLPTGDRATRPILVQVQSDGRGRDRFVPLNR